MTITSQRNVGKMLPFMLYLGTYTLTSFIHMMSVHEGNVAFGFTLATFHGYSFIVIYSLLMKFMEGKPEESEEEKEKIEDAESGLGEGGEEEEEDVPYIA